LPAPLVIARCIRPIPWRFWGFIRARLGGPTVTARCAGEAPPRSRRIRSAAVNLCQIITTERKGGFLARSKSRRRPPVAAVMIRVHSPIGNTRVASCQQIVLHGFTHVLGVHGGVGLPAPLVIARCIRPIPWRFWGFIRARLGGPTVTARCAGEAPPRSRRIRSAAVNLCQTVTTERKGGFLARSKSRRIPPVAAVMIRVHSPIGNTSNAVLSKTAAVVVHAVVRVRTPQVG